jgi:hypothetical protein
MRVEELFNIRTHLDSIEEEYAKDGKCNYDMIKQSVRAIRIFLQLIEDDANGR